MGETGRIMKDIVLQRLLTRRKALANLGVAAVGISVAGGLASCGGPAGDGAAGGEAAKLNFYNWDTYIGETTLADFNAATGIEVSMDLFSTNDELFAKLRAGNPGYDVIVPSNDFVARMIEAGMLMELDRTKIPNFNNLAPEYQDTDYDPGQRHSIPYTWLVEGIGYRKSKVDGVPDSWKWLFDSDRYSGRISLLSEATDVFKLGFKYLGYPLNDITPERVAEVEALLIKQKPHIRVFHEDNGQDLLLSGEVDLVLEYNGDIAQVMLEDDDIGFVVPQEGSMISADNLAIPVGAPHVENAHAFINYILDAEAGKHIAETIQYPTPNAAAKALMPDTYRDNPAIYPPMDVLTRCEYSRFKGQEAQEMLQEAMTRVRAA